METMIPHSEERKRTLLDWVILGVVVAIALVVIALSFTNTTKLARELGLNEYLTAGLVEILFASLLFIRGRQRATQRNVPLFLSVGYFTSLGFVTGINMWGLSLENPTIGPIVGGAISAAMWLMESVLVWLWVDSHRPHQKSLRELKREAKARRKAAKLHQEIEWMDYISKKPDLNLIQKARREEQKREKIISEGIPEFFNKQEINEQTLTKKQTRNKTNRQTEREQTNEKQQTITKQTNDKQTQSQTKQAEQVNKKKQTNKGEQTTEKQTSGNETNIKQGINGNKQDLDEQNNQTNGNKVIYINEQQEKQTTSRTYPTYEQLVEMLDIHFKENKKLPTVRGFAEQTGIKPNRSYKAIKMWKEANEQKYKKIAND